MDTAHWGHNGQHATLLTIVFCIDCRSCNRLLILNRPKLPFSERSKDVTWKLPIDLKWFKVRSFWDLCRSFSICQTVTDQIDLSIAKLIDWYCTTCEGFFETSSRSQISLKDWYRAWLRRAADTWWKVLSNLVLLRCQSFAIFYCQPLSPALGCVFPWVLLSSKSIKAII